MPSDKSLAPIFPVRPGCPLWLLVEWAEVFHAGLRSRSKVLLETQPSVSGRPAERWFVLVRYRRGAAALANSLPRPLRAECTALRVAGIDRWTVAQVFRRLRSRAQSVVSVSLSRWGGAPVFIRLPADDLRIGRLVVFNARARQPRAWLPPKPRHYPASLRQAYARGQWRSGGSVAPPP